MRKRICNIFMIGAMAITFAACTDNPIGSEIQAGSVITEVDYQGLLEQSDVPINVISSATPEVIAKGSIPSTSKGYFDADSISFFMLAMKENQPSAGLTIDWSKHQDIKLTAEGKFVADWQKLYKNNTDVWSVYYAMDNVRAYASSVRDAYTADTIRTDIHWYDNINRYYPMGNYHTYGFFAYAPRNNTEIEYKTTRVNALVAHMDGTKDIICGKATADEVTTAQMNQDTIAKYEVTEGSTRMNELKSYAYSAKFYRQPENRDNSKPTMALTTPMTFTHVTMKVNFKIQPGYESDGGDGYSFARATRIDTIAITDVPSTVRLCVAGRGTDASNTGIITDFIDRDTVYYLKDSIDGKPDQELTIEGEREIKPHTETVDGKVVPKVEKIGEGILLPILPEAEADKPYRLMLVVSYPEEDGTMVKHRLIYPMALPTTSYAAGKVYTFLLTIYHPKKMAGFTATLTPWTESAEDAGMNIY